MRVNAFHDTAFLRSAPRLRHLPADEGREVAFAGSSNVGKSSIINTLSGRDHLAHTSRTPGRTCELNFFQVRPGARLVDLPGYGYARVPQALRRHWGGLMAGYLARRRSLAGIVVVMDIRRPLRVLDAILLEQLTQAQIPFHLVLNKADKLSHGDCRDALRAVVGAPESAGSSVQLFSSVNGSGTDELRGVVQRWLAGGDAKKTAPVHRGR